MAAPSTLTKEQINANIANDLNIILYALIGGIILFRLPHTIIRLCDFYEWKSVLTHRHLSSSLRTVDPASSGSSATDASDPNASTSGLLNCPPHVPSTYIKSLYPVMSVLRVRIAPGISIGYTLIILVYLVVIAQAAFRHGAQGSPFTDPQRAGWIIMTQVPLVFALATKTNVIGFLCSIGYEKLIAYHRVVGTLMFVGINVHGLGYIYKWTIASDFKRNISNNSYTWGFVGLISLDLLFIFSTSFIRKRFHNVFMAVHVFGFILFLVAAHQHRPQLAPYVYAAIAIYGFDRLMRVLKTRIAKAHIQPLTELGITRITVPSIRSGWRAGQHIRLRVLTTEMGFLACTEVHPFTIANICATKDRGGDGHEGMVLLCKSTGGWTKKLYDIATSSITSTAAGEDGEFPAEATIPVMVEGPYGGPGNTILSNFSACLLIVAGSGITYALPIIQDVFERESQGRSRVKFLQLVWIIQDPSAVTPLLDIFASLDKEAQAISLSFSIMIYYTRNPRCPASTKALMEKSDFVRFVPNRPDILNVIRSSIESTLLLRGEPHKCQPSDTCDEKKEDAESILPSSGFATPIPDTIFRTNGMIVGVCGPSGLGDDVVKAVGNVLRDMKRDIGGVEICEEIFGL